MAAAQTSDDAARAARLLAASWRPFALTNAGDPQAAFLAACEGAIEEMAALDAALPDDLDPQALAEVRASRGLVIVPAGDNPALAYLFAGADLPGIASGMAGVRVIDAALGRVDLIDAAGAAIPIQLGAAGQRPMLRVLTPDQPPQSFVRCASTLD